MELVDLVEGFLEGYAAVRSMQIQHSRFEGGEELERRLEYGAQFLWRMVARVDWIHSSCRVSALWQMHEKITHLVSTETSAGSFSLAKSWEDIRIQHGLALVLAGGSAHRLCGPLGVQPRSVEFAVTMAEEDVDDLLALAKVGRAHAVLPLLTHSHGALSSHR